METFAVSEISSANMHSRNQCLLETPTQKRKVICYDVIPSKSDWQLFLIPHGYLEVLKICSKLGIFPWFTFTE